MDWAGVLVPAILLRIIVNIDLNGQPVFVKYVNLAESLFKSRGTPFHSSPVYSFWLYAVHQMAGLNIDTVRWLQAFLGIGSVIILMLIAASLYGRRAALLSGLIYGICTPVVIYESDLVTTSVDVFFQALCAWSIIRRLKKPDSSAVGWLFPGLWLGLSIGLRPNMLLTVPMLAAVAFPSLKDKLKLVVPIPGRRVGFLIGIAAAVAPITISNYLQSGECIAVTGSGGAVFYSSNNYRATGLGYSPPPALTEIENRWMRDNQVDKPVEHAVFKYLAERAAGKALTNRQVSSFYNQEARHFLMRHPLKSAGLWTMKLFYLLNNYEVLDTGSLVLRGDRIRELLPFEFPAGIAIATGLLGLIIIPYKDRRVWVILSFILTNAATAVIFYVNGRLRVPLIFFCAVFAGKGILELLRRIRERSPDVWITLVGVMGIISLISWRNDVLRRHADMETPAFLSETKGLAALQKGYGDEAERWFREAASRNPMGAREAWENLAQLYRMKGDSRNGAECEARAKGIWSHTDLEKLWKQGFLTEYEYGMATAQSAWKDGKPDKAAEIFEQVMQRNSCYPEPWFNLAVLESKKSRPDWGLIATYCEQALSCGMKLDLASTRAHSLLINAYTMLNRRDSADMVSKLLAWETELKFSP